jgi:hypothetical protein
MPILAFIEAKVLDIPPPRPAAFLNQTMLHTLRSALFFFNRN